jgi:integrase
MEPAPAVLLHPSVTGRFTAHAPGLSGPARRTLRTSLRFLARKVVPHLDPADKPLPRERARAPYTAAEIDGYLALAAAQPTTARAMRATALVCLGAAAGLIRSDLRQARGADVTARSGGVIVQVRGRKPRAVPVLARYHQPLLQAAALASEHLLTGGIDPARGNITSPLARSLAGGTGLPRLDTSRLRATCLADTAALIGLSCIYPPCPRCLRATVGPPLGYPVAAPIGQDGSVIEHAERPWGSYTVLAEGDSFKVKAIEVRPASG